MTVVADNKKRVTLRIAKPGDRYDVQVLDGGRVLLTKLVKQLSEAELVKPVMRNGLLVLPGEPDEEAIVQQLKEERENLNARLLG